MTFKIDNNTPPIVSFPDDDYPRVVWAYGAVLKDKKSTSNTPTVVVMLKDICDGKVNIESETYVEISAVELDIVRMMYIWLGNRKTTSVWKDFKRYKEKMKFEFNFKQSSVKSIAFNTKKPNSNYFFIPSFVYNLGKIESKQNIRYFLNTQFTHLTSIDNKTILIPALELFTSTYVPRDKIMRAKLLTSSYQNVIDYYIKSATIKDNEYHVEFNKNKQISNEVFLAYLALNKNTQNSLTILRSSLETDSNYDDRYPVIHPYSPENFEIEADGAWIDDDTFMIFRINGYSIPVESDLVIHEEDHLSVDSDEDPYQKRIRQSKEIKNNNIPIDDRLRPHDDNASKYTTSEVVVLNKDKVRIEYTKKSLEVNVHHKYYVENTDGITMLSSSESSHAKESKNVGKYKMSQDNAFYKEGIRIDQSAVINMTKSSIEYLLNNKIPLGAKEKELTINEFRYVDGNCAENNRLVLASFFKILKETPYPIYRWIKKYAIIDNIEHLVGYRAFMLIKIILSNNKFAYLLEIERKNENESFSGLIFNLQGNNIDQKSLVKLIFGLSQKNGIFDENKTQIKKYITFKHRIKNNNTNENIKHAIEKAIYENIFI